MKTLDFKLVRNSIIVSLIGFFILFSTSAIAQCEVTTDFGYSAENFDQPRQYGEICFYFDINFANSREIECLSEYILDVEFPMGSFIYTEFDSDYGTWEIIEDSSTDNVILRLKEIPLVYDLVISKCFKGLVQDPGVELYYKIYNPNSNHVAQSAEIIPE